MLNSIAAGLGAPTDSVAGIATATLAPAVSYRIGQAFKKSNEEGSLKHILAHAIVGAVVAQSGGNNALAGALSAGGAEAIAPRVAEYLYGKKGSELNAEQKETVSSIMSLAGAGVGAAVGDTTANATQGSLNAENAVENNDFNGFMGVPNNFSIGIPTDIQIWTPENDRILNDSIKEFEGLVRLIPLVDAVATGDEKLQQWHQAKTVEEKLQILQGLPETIVERAITAKAGKLLEIAKKTGKKSKEFVVELEELVSQMRNNSKLATVNGAKMPNHAMASKSHNNENNSSNTHKKHNKTPEDVIAERVKDLDLNSYPLANKQLSSKKMKELKNKIEDRTITKEEYKLYTWNKRFNKRRNDGVAEFWQQEAERIKSNMPTTRNWTPTQMNDILQGKRPVNEYGEIFQGHHTYSASKYPHLSNKGEVIYPALPKEHFQNWHGGNWKTSLPGKPIKPLKNKE